MKKIKILLLMACVAAITLFNSTAFAQEVPKDLKNKTPEQRAEFQTSLMKTKLQLTDDQTAKVKSINLNYATKFEPIIKSSDNKFSKLKKAKDVQKAKNSELKKVFTADQYKKYEAMESELKEKMKDKM